MKNIILSAVLRCGYYDIGNAESFFLIFIAEMGDKTQILAMAFATKFPVKKVLTGVFIGVLLNHGLGVIVGKYISGIIPTNIIQVVAGFAFLCFAFGL